MPTKRHQGLFRSHAISFHCEAMREIRKLLLPHICLTGFINSQSRSRDSITDRNTQPLPASSTTTNHTKALLGPARPLGQERPWVPWPMGQVTPCQNQQGIACRLHDNKILILSMNVWMRPTVQHASEEVPVRKASYTQLCAGINPCES